MGLSVGMSKSFDIPPDYRREATRRGPLGGSSETTSETPPRLFLQPHGFEGFGRLSEVAKFGHRPIANRKNTGSRRVDLNAAHAPASALPARDQHVLIKITRPFDLKSPVCPTLAHVAEELEHAVCSRVAHGLANGPHGGHLESSITPPI